MGEFDNHKFTAVPPEYQKQGIKWVRIIPRKKGDGVFIMQYDDLSKPCLYDWWFENINIAMEEAKRIFGIEPYDWVDATDIRNLGIEIIDEQ